MGHLRHAVTILNINYYHFDYLSISTVGWMPGYLVFNATGPKKYVGKNANHFSPTAAFFKPEEFYLIVQTDIAFALAVSLLSFSFYKLGLLYFVLNKSFIYSKYMHTNILYTYIYIHTYILTRTTIFFSRWSDELSAVRLCFFYSCCFFTLP